MRSKKNLLGVLTFLIAHSLSSPAYSQSVVVEAQSADTTKLMELLHKRYNKGPIPLDRVETVAGSFARTGNPAPVDPNKKFGSLILNAKLKHYVADGPFLWGSYGTAISNWPKAGRRVTEICEDKFEGEISVLSVKDIKALSSKGKGVPIPSRNNEVIDYSAIEKVAYVAGRKTYNTSDLVGVYTCKISPDRQWSVYVDQTIFAGRITASLNGESYNTTTMAILPLDFNGSPLLETAIIETRKLKIQEQEDELLRSQQAKMRTLEREANLQTLEQERQRIRSINQQEDAKAKMSLKENLKPGQNTNCGMVVEVKTPVILVQPTGLNTVAQWVSLDDIDIPGKNCHKLSIRGYK